MFKLSRINSRRRILDSALDLIKEGGEAAVTMSEIADACGISRQAVYLHFADRADLLVAVARHVDEKVDIAGFVKKIIDASTGIAALGEAAGLQARTNPEIWKVARAVDAVRRVDEAAEHTWQDRLQDRLTGCRHLAKRLKTEGLLRKGLDTETAAELIWTLTSLHTWEDLVVQRGWRARK